MLLTYSLILIYATGVATYLYLYQVFNFVINLFILHYVEQRSIYKIKKEFNEVG